MPATLLTPAALDQAAARYAPAALTPAEEGAWRGITTGFERTAPADRDARRLVTKTVDELVTEALGSVNIHGQRPPVEIRMPGRLGGILPGRLNRNRRDLSQPPSVILYAAAQVLEEYGWQAKPHHLRDWRGRRCVCGAICTAYDLGVGSIEGAHAAAWYVLAELRERYRWPHLIGDWNQVSSRTPEQAIGLVHAARSRAIRAGQ